MKKTIGISVIMYILIIACTPTQKPPKLFIKTISIIEVGGKKIDTETVTIIDSDYFEVTLNSLVDKSKGYSAKQKLEHSDINEDYKYVFFIIVDEKDSSEYFFKSGTAFLNYMSERGYQMVDQTKKKYSTDYTFQKK